MATTSTTKIATADGTRGPDGEIILAAGERSAMRMWRNEEPGEPKTASTRDYETVGFVLNGKAELHLDGDVVTLTTGDSYTVPAGISHTYKILETFSAIEATTPPARA